MKIKILNWVDFPRQSHIFEKMIIYNLRNRFLLLPKLIIQKLIMLSKIRLSKISGSS